MNALTGVRLITDSDEVHWGHPEPVEGITTVCMMTDSVKVTYVNDDVTCRSCISELVWISEVNDQQEEPE